MQADVLDAQQVLAIRHRRRDGHVERALVVGAPVGARRVERRVVPHDADLEPVARAVVSCNIAARRLRHPEGQRARVLHLGAVIGDEGDGVAGRDGGDLGVGGGGEAVRVAAQVVGRENVGGVLRFVALGGFADVLPLLGGFAVDDELRPEVVGRGHGGEGGDGRDELLGEEHGVGVG